MAILISQPGKNSYFDQVKLSKEYFDKYTFEANPKIHISHIWSYDETTSREIRSIGRS